MYSVVRSGSKVFLGGDFTSVAGLPRTSLAEVDASTAVPSTWAPFPESDGTVLSLALSASTLYVGGRFSRMNLTTVNGIAAFDLASGAMTDFRAGTNGGTGIMALAVHGTSLFMGGGFSQVLTTFRHGLAEVDATTGQVQSWNPGLAPFSEVRAIVVTQRTSAPFERTVWIGGDFTQVLGVPRSHLAAIGGTVTAQLLSWNPGASDPVNSLFVRSSGLTGAAVAIYVGGEFTAVGGLNRNFLAAVDPAGVTTPGIPQPNGTVYSLAYGIDGIRAGGDFFSAGMVSRENFAALDSATGVATPWNPGADGGVNSIEHLDDTLLVAGAFALIGGSNRSGLARIETSTGLATNWNPNLSCSTCGSPAVHAVVRSADGEVLYLGGEFDAVDGLVRRNIAAIATNSAAPLLFDANLDGRVRTIAVHEQSSFPFHVTLYAGGDFTTVNGGLFGYGPGGTARYGLAALDGTSGEASTWNPSRATWGGVAAVGLTASGQGNSVIVWVGGSFTEVGPYPTPDFRSNAAAFDAGTAVPTSWQPDPNGAVTAILLANGKCYLGGTFTILGGVVRHHLGSVDLGTGAVFPWDPDVYGVDSILALKALGNAIHTGGSFTGMSGTAHRYYAAITEPTVVAIEPDSPLSGPRSITAWPTPFVSRTTIRFALTRSEDVEIEVFDVSGRLVRRIHRGVMGAGTHEMSWDGRDAHGSAVAAGVYLWSLRRGADISSAKVVRMQ